MRRSCSRLFIGGLVLGEVGVREEIAMMINSRERRPAIGHGFCYRGENQTLAHWCRVLGVPRRRLEYRLSHGWTLKQALETPVPVLKPSRLRELRKTMQLTQQAVARRIGVSSSHFGHIERGVVGASVAVRARLERVFSNRRLR